MENQTSALPPIIELKGIKKAFGNDVILNGLDLNIYRGDALVIIGPSGTGKSTILRLIAGLLLPDEGDIYVNGKKRVGLIDDHKDFMAISMVFQQAALFDSLTVRENVGFLLYQHSRLSAGKISTIVEQSLEMVGLSGKGELYPSELSGGMRKRVSFARAVTFNPENVAQRPEVILYDEPTAGLDPIASTVIEDLVTDLRVECAACQTYVMVTHQESTIRRTGEKIIFLYNGKVQWEGQVNDIDNTDNELVRQFFSARREGPIQVV